LIGKPEKLVETEDACPEEVDEQDLGLHGHAVHLDDAASEKWTVGVSPTANHLKN
jgi:hypothetical protein